MGSVLPPGVPGSKKGGGPPAPPDYAGAAEKTAQGNRPTQNTPFGQQSWTHDANGNWTQNTSLAPGLQGAATGLQNQFASANASPLDNGQQARTNAENAVYGQESSRLDPYWQQQQQQFNSSLTNQGIDPNSAAGQAAYGNFNRGRNDAYSSAQNQAITMGGQQAQIQQGLDMNSRMAPLQGLSGLQALLQMPGFQAGPNYLGAAGMQGNYQLEGQQLQNQGNADYWSNLAQLGQAFMPRPGK